jgi:hypothetical protein
MINERLYFTTRVITMFVRARKITVVHEKRNFKDHMKLESGKLL